MGEISAGLLMYRRRNGRLEVFLVHPGGPLFAKKDEGVWSIPKGLVEPGEDLLAAAKREFQEETGIAPHGEFLPLGSVRLPSGKTIYAWAFEGDWDPSRGIQSNEFEMEWPPRSGRKVSCPEIDRAAFFTLEEARKKIHSRQRPFLERVENAQNGITASANGNHDAISRDLPGWMCLLDHTADVGFFVQADSLPGLFARAAWAMFSVITDIGKVRPVERHTVTVEASDREALMVAWLSELNFRHVTEHNLFSRFEVNMLSGTRLEGEVYGEAIDPNRHVLLREIKAVTFHNLIIANNGHCWTAQIIFDV